MDINWHPRICIYCRYTILVINYAFSLLLLMLVRPIVSLKFVQCRGTKSIYVTLYFLPILIVLQAVFGGLLCICTYIPHISIRLMNKRFLFFPRMNFKLNNTWCKKLYLWLQFTKQILDIQLFTHFSPLNLQIQRVKVAEVDLLKQFCLVCWNWWFCGMCEEGITCRCFLHKKKSHQLHTYMHIWHYM